MSEFAVARTQQPARTSSGMTASTQIKTFAEIQRYELDGDPDWRWERVLVLADGSGGRPTRRFSRRDDYAIRVASRFLLRHHNGGKTARRKLMRDNPGLWYAYHYQVR